MSQNIKIKGAKEHNLKNIDLSIPRDKFVVFTGVSGSGKSSLAFDTLYAEGQRRYVESLSAYARQFLGQMEKPKVDYIEGLSPAISIEQKAASKNPRSTVGTVTEIYDYLRILFARVGEQYCHICGQKVGKQSIDQMVSYILSKGEGKKVQILAPLVNNRKGEHLLELQEARKEGFSRVLINGIVRDLSEKIVLDKKSKHSIDIVVDRLILSKEKTARLVDSLETTLQLTDGLVKISFNESNKVEILSEKNSCPSCGIGFDSLSPQHFSFNSPIGMCPRCNGLGTFYEFDEHLIVPNDNLSILDGAVVVWGEVKNKLNAYEIQMVKQVAKKYNFSLSTPWKSLPKTAKNILLYGTKDEKIEFSYSSKRGNFNFFNQYEGIINALQRRIKQTSSDHMKRYYLEFMGNKKCYECGGKKLKPQSLSVLINNHSIADVNKKTIKEVVDFFIKLKLTKDQNIIATDIIDEIKNRSEFLLNVGLHYLTLDRSAPTLSGGESQRIRLASQIGSGLVGVMYILDEPSIGLHQKDNSNLIKMLVKLKDIGNSVIVVEHDEQTIRSADYIVDFGPKAGFNGGEIVAKGSLKKIISEKRSLTGAYLSKKTIIKITKKRRKIGKNFITIKGAKQNNLKNIKVKIPISVFTAITGVSGSGKSSLINQILLPASANKLNRANKKQGLFSKIEGLENLDKVIAINQQPIGRTPRSNPATYIKVFDSIRQLFASLPASKLRGYTPGRFSFNVKGGRCEACGGAGLKLIEMHFLPDIFIECNQCKGKRYNKETLRVKYKEKNISQFLEMDVSEAFEYFRNIPSISSKLSTLMEVGLDYIKLGQPSTTLSGGEAQRIKLAKELSKTSTGKTLYILDEPTTGLHFDDIKKLLSVIFKLTDMGNTIIVIEHNLDVIKCADYLIDMGVEGGQLGGNIVGVGTPEQLAKNKQSYTGKYLKEILKNDRIDN